MGAPSVVSYLAHLVGRELRICPRQGGATVCIVSWTKHGSQGFAARMRRLESLVGVAFSERARLLERG